MEVKKQKLILLLSICGFSISCVSVDNFDFNSYSAAKVESVLYEEPIIDKADEKARKEQVEPKKVITPAISLEEAVENREQIEAQGGMDIFKPIRVTRREGELKLYTPQFVIDDRHPNHWKGGAFLVWSKVLGAANYEVKIYRQGKTDRNIFKVDKHHFYIMVHPDKNYFWSVRVLDAAGKPTTNFVPFRPLRVTKRAPKRSLKTPVRGLSSEKKKK